MSYHLTCPRCGGHLHHLIALPDSPPWACDPCRRAYWCAELTPAAHAAWRPLHRDFGLGTAIAESCEAELAEALLRGCSIRPDQLPRLKREEVDLILKWPLEAEFRSQVEAHKATLS